MSKKQVRMKVLGGRLEPLEELPLVEGSEVTVVVDLPDRPGTAAKPRLALPKWNLGVKEPLTRHEIYEDVG